MKLVFKVYCVLAAIFAGGCGLFFMDLKYGIENNPKFGQEKIFIIIAVCANLLMASIARSEFYKTGLALIVIALTYASIQFGLLYATSGTELNDMAGILTIVTVPKLLFALVVGFYIMQTAVKP